MRITPGGATIGRSRMRLVGARASAPAQPQELLAGYTNYLLDADPRKWRTHVPNYRRVRYGNVYPGIDVVYYGNPHELEFDFVVAPGSDPRRIRLALSGTDLRIRLPRVYQSDSAVEARAVRHGGSVTFELAAYDRSRPLVIDPVLSFATIFGGGGSDEGRAIAVDSTGATYVAGNAFDANFPVVNGKPGQFAFLAKISPAGDALVYSTYLPLPLGGGPGPGNYAVDSSGSVYVASGYGFGGTSAPPVVGPAPLRDCGAGGPPHIYVAKLSPDGASMVYSGCIRGSSFETPSAIAVDGAGNAYVAGTTQSPDFPLVNPLPSSLPLAQQGPPRAFLFKLNPDGALLYSTFFGGSNGDFIQAIAADPAGNIYLTGNTNSADFPLKNAIQPRPPSGTASFVAKINAAGSDLVYSTYYGGSNGASGSAITADSVGNAYLAGSTTSGDLRTTSDALQNKFNGVFAYKSVDGAANWSRSDAGLPGSVNALKIDPRNPSNIYVVSSGHVYKSSDRGATWQPTSATSAGGLWVNPADSTLYVSTNPGSPLTGNILRSRDGGATFTTLSTGLKSSLNQMVFDPQNASVIYGRFGGAGNQGDGIYKSADGGDTWKPTGISGSGTGSGGFAIDPAHPSTLYASTHQGGLMRSADGGDTWTTIGGQVNQILVDANSTLYAVSGVTILVLPLGGVTVQKVAPASVNTLVIDPTNTSTWYAITYGPSGPGIYKTTDSGDTWQRAGNGLPNSAGGALAIDPSSPGTLYLGAVALPDGFFAKLSPDGSSLLYSTYLGGNGNDSVTAIATDAAGNAYLAGTTDSSDFPMQAPFRTAAAGASDGFVAKFDPANVLAWSSSLGGGTPRAIALGPAGEVYLTGGTSSAAFPTTNSIQPFISGNFFRTADRGATWTASSPTMSPATQFGPFFTPAVAIDPKTPSRVFALSDRLYVSNDRGQSWTPLGSPSGTTPQPFFPPPVFGPFAGLLLVLDPLTPTTMYAAGVCQVVVNGPPNCGVSKSTDGGVTWTLSPLTVPASGPQPAFVNGLAIDPKTPSILYASTGNAGIYKTTDAGATWSRTGSVTTTNAVVVDPLNPAVLYASSGSNTIGFLSKSNDAGATWAIIANGLPLGWFANLLVTDPVMQGRVYAVGSFPTTGLYRTDNSGNNWIKIGSGLPDGAIFALAVDPATPAMVYAAPSGGGLYRSTNAGASFTLMPGLRIPIVNAIAIDPTNGSQIYTGTQFNPGDAFVMKIVP